MCGPFAFISLHEKLLVLAFFLPQIKSIWCKYGLGGSVHLSKHIKLGRQQVTHHNNNTNNIS